MAKNQPNNITVFRKQWNINIGIIIFGVIFLYLVVTVLLYVTGTHVSVYEVREGSILKDNAYTGLAIREETVIRADTSGYVNYFASEGTKVGTKSRVYSLSNNELEFTENSTEETENLTAEEREALLVKMQSFSTNFSEQNYNSVYTMKSEIQSLLEKKSNQNRQTQLDAMLENGTTGLEVYNSQMDGVIIYSVDGLEDINVSDVTADMVEKKDYNLTSFRDNMYVNAGNPVYKLVRSDAWSLIIMLDDETTKKLADNKHVKVQFSKDQVTEKADFEVYTTKDANLGILTFDSSMVRYAAERYLNIELIMEDETGLKIPKSSVIEKEFYVVPESYLTQGGNSQETGVLIESGSNNAKFTSVDVYYRDTETGMVYLNPAAFEKNTTLIKPDSSDTYTLKKTKTLRGVYNINKGYAVFKQIQILCESEEYYIVESGNDYGLTNYDHIALIGKDVKENDIVS